MPFLFAELDPEIAAIASGDWGLQDPLRPIPGYFAEDPEEWMRRHNRFNAISEAGGVNLLFIGDSITEAWGAPEQRELWEINYAPYGAANFGIGGDRTQQILWRIENGNLDGISPKVVVLKIGVNNIWHEDSVPGKVAEGVIKVVTEIRRHLPATKILLQAVLPTGQFPDNAYRAKVKEINAIISHLDNGDTIRFINFGEIFVEPDGSISAETMPDFCHLSTRAYAQWADAIRPLLTEMMS